MNYPSLLSLKKGIENEYLVKDGVYPVLIFDHFENIDPKKKCYICLALKELFEIFKLNVIILTNSESSVHIL